MFPEAELRQILEKMTDNYKNEELFYVKPGHQLPNRNTIIQILRGLRKIMFPGYFDDEPFNRNMPDFFLGHNIINLYDALTAQIKAAFVQQEKDAADEAKLTESAEAMCTCFFSALPQIQQVLMRDVQAAFDGDPAAPSKEEVIFCYPGLFAIFVYRIAHELYRLQIPFIPRIMSEYAHSHTGIDINPGAQIGEYFFIDHGTGVVIGETTIIGDRVKIYQGVTLGALSTRSGQLLRNTQRHPTIEDDVTIYSSASILGGKTVIGKGAVIGGNCFITESVPAGAHINSTGD